LLKASLAEKRVARYFTPRSGQRLLRRRQTASFVGGEDFLGKAIAVALQTGADAADVANVGADTVNHDYKPNWHPALTQQALAAHL